MAWEERLAPGLRILARRVALIAAACVGLIGLVGILGWITDIDVMKTLAPGGATMKLNTALCFLFSAVAIWSGTARGAPAWISFLHQWAPVFVGAIAMLTLWEFALDANFGIDELLVQDHDAVSQAAPGRMSLPTGAAFAMFAWAMRASLKDTRATRFGFLIATGVGLAIATLCLIGYAYDLPLLYQPIPESSISLNTAAAFFVLFIGVSALRPDLSWFALLEATSITGVFARWLFPAIVFFPILLGWAIYGLTRASWVAPQEALALFALGSVLGLGAVTWGVGLIANRLGRQLALREQVLSAVVETALDAFVMMDQHGRVLHWNPRAETMFGWSRAEALSAPLAEMIIPTPMRALHRDGLERFVKTGEGPAMRQRLEFEAIDRDGRTFPIELMIYPVRIHGEWLFSAFIKDVSAMKQAEAQLRQAQKMEAVGQLTGGVAHDFNNLLTVVIVTLDSLRNRVAEDLRPRLEGALQAAERGAALTKQLLAFSRRQTLNPEQIDLNATAEGLRELLERTLGAAIDIEYRLTAQPCPAFADKVQVETALLNLAINARDAMPSGGRLLIETANVELDQDYSARNAEAAPGRYAMLAVSDTGTGMSPQVRERAFEPFFTTKDVGKGSGLGLSMIYGFAQQSKGHVKIYSEAGHGTTIRIYLPHGDLSALPTTLQERPVEDRQARGETILVVEDDAEVRATALLHLNELGYVALEAADAAEALRLLENGAKADLLFTDVVMPGGINGRQLAERASAMRPELKTLFTSGFTDNAIVHDGRLDPGVKFLAKPYRIRDLAEKIRDALDN